MPQIPWPLDYTRVQTLHKRLSSLIQRAPQQVIVFVAGALLALGLWAALALWPANNASEIEVNRPSPETYRAPYSIEFVSELRTAENQAQAENDPDNLIYSVHTDQPFQQREALRELLETISSIRTDPTLSSAQKREELTSLPSSSLAISPTLASSILSLSESDWTSVRSQSLGIYNQLLDEFDYEIDNQSFQRISANLLPRETRNLPQPQRDLVQLFVESFLRVNRVLDEEATEQAKQAARAAVDPVVVEVQAGETIVRVGEIVRPEMIEKLQATGLLGRQLTGYDLAGLGLLSAMLSMSLMVYLSFLQKKIVEQPRALFVLIGMLLITVLAARVLLEFWSAYPYALPIATTALVLAVVFNSHLALAGMILLSVVVGIMGDTSLELAIITLVGGAIAVFSVRGAERTLTFLLAGLTIAVATMLTEISFWMMGRTLIAASELQPIIFFSATNGALSAVLALGMFNIVGRIAGVVTPLQLMELAHPSQPLLRKVMREAPGTYYHSVSVGNLAEAAAEAVGADSLLLRVAAYYHDIGKTIRPYFFTDNQMGRENIHNDLDPQTSASIIIDHITEGLKMAEDARLPQPIIDFIATHHGTSVVSHFYQMALRQQDSVEIDDFRYPGPRPFTREQGILMLADSVEATVRSKAQYGQLVAKPANGDGSNGRSTGGGQTIPDLVGSIIDERVRSGQLDNTSLTLRDLIEIRQAFITTLQGIYHPRVQYAQTVVKTPG